MMDENQSEIRERLRKRNLSGAQCDKKIFSSWKDTGKAIGANKVYTDPAQGSCNDCYFIAALISVAWAANAKLKNYPNYQFYSTVNPIGWQQVSLNNSNLAVDANNNLVYARTNSGNIWPCLYEKAFAKWLDPNKSDTPPIGTLLNGGNGLTALLNICGGTWSSNTFTNLHQNPSIIPLIPGQTRTQYPTIADAKSGNSLGLIGDHTYVVLNRSGGKFELHNPCGGSNSTVTAIDSSNFNYWGYVIPV